MTPAATVYVATNTVNGHRYVGVTRFTVAHRWKIHSYTASRAPRTYLHRAIAKYGSAAFAVEAVVSCLSRESSGQVERAIITQLQPHYNQTNGGESTRGRRISPEVAERIRASNTGKRRTPEQREANGARTKARHAADPAYRATSIGALARGRANPNVVAKRLRAAAESARHRVWSDESRAKLSASCTGRTYDRDVIDKMRASKRKAVRCLESGEVFACCDEAAAKLGISVHGIYKVCAGKRQSVNGLTFSYGASA